MYFPKMLGTDIEPIRTIEARYKMHTFLIYTYWQYVI